MSHTHVVTGSGDIEKLLILLLLAEKKREVTVNGGLMMCVDFDRWAVAVERGDYACTITYRLVDRKTIDVTPIELERKP